MKRVLVTGGTGFVGANLVRRLVLEGCRVELLVRPQHNSRRLRGLEGEVVVHIAELADPERVRAVVRAARPEWIFHLAAHGGYSWETDPHRMVATNVTGTVALMEECRAHGFEAFVNTGSSSEYGWKDHAPTEDEVLDPNSAYAATKAAATHYCRQAALAEGLPVRTLRLYSAYGPWEDPRRLIPTLLAHARNGELPPLAAPDTARDFVYVEDVCDAYLLAARTAGQESGAIYNVGSGTQTSLREIVDLARRLFGVADEPQWNTIPSRTWDTGIWVADAGKIRATLGWTPQTSLEAGLLRTMEAGED